MPYTIPTFNLSVRIWRNGNPVTNPPDVSVTGNLALGRRVVMSPGTARTFMYLLLPKLTDIRGSSEFPNAPDVVEVPALSGRYYLAVFVDDIGKGFPNEHRFALLEQGTVALGTPAWPAPIP